LSRICLITYYLPKVLVSSVGMSRAASLLVAGLCTTEYVLASIFQVFMVGWLKRRTMLFISSAGEITSMTVLAITVWHGGFGAGIVATVMLFGFNTFYSFGWLTVWKYKSLRSDRTDMNKPGSFRVSSRDHDFAASFQRLRHCFRGSVDH
jgi:hypothetical protein